MIALAPSGSADAKNARFTTACVEDREPLDWSEDDTPSRNPQSERRPQGRAKGWVGMALGSLA